MMACLTNCLVIQVILLNHSDISTEDALLGPEGMYEELFGISTLLFGYLEFDTLKVLTVWYDGYWLLLFRMKTELQRSSHILSYSQSTFCRIILCTLQGHLFHVTVSLLPSKGVRAASIDVEEIFLCAVVKTLNPAIQYKAVWAPFIISEL